MSDNESESGDQSISMEEFKRCVKMFTQIHDEITRKKKEIKEETKKLNMIGEKVKSYMQSQNKLCCDLGEHGSLELKTRKQTSGMGKKALETTLTSFFNNNEKKSKELIEFINKQKKIKETVVIKRNV